MRFLDELSAAGREHDATLADRTECLRNVEPETARMLSVLVHAVDTGRVLQVGTSNGYSTVGDRRHVAVATLPRPGRRRSRRECKFQEQRRRELER